MDIKPNQHAFITGGASGIGLGIAQALADKGVCVTIADIDDNALTNLPTALPHPHFAIKLDVRNPQQWHNCKVAAENKFGPVDILINNAGISFDGEALADINPDSVNQVLSINLMGIYHGLSCFAADMRARQQGHIVNTASVMGLLQGVAGMGIYSASKAAVVALSEALRSEMAPYNVGVSVLCPGLVTSNLRENTVKLGGVVKNATRKNNAQKTAMPAREAGDIVVFGIMENVPYLLTHPEHLDNMQRRVDAVRDSVDTVLHRNQ